MLGIFPSITKACNFPKSPVANKLQQKSGDHVLAGSWEQVNTACSVDHNQFCTLMRYTVGQVGQCNVCVRLSPPLQDQDGWLAEKAQWNHPLPAETDAPSFKTGSYLFHVQLSRLGPAQILWLGVISGSVCLCCCRYEVHQSWPRV